MSDGELETPEDFARLIIGWWPEDQRHPLPTLIATVRSYTAAVRADERRKCDGWNQTIAAAREDERRKWKAKFDKEQATHLRAERELVARAEKAERERDELKALCDKLARRADAAEGDRNVGDSNWTTPMWCPLRNEAIEAALGGK